MASHWTRDRIAHIGRVCRGPSCIGIGAHGGMFSCGLEIGTEMTIYQCLSDRVRHIGIVTPRCAVLLTGAFPRNVSIAPLGFRSTM